MSGEAEEKMNLELIINILGVDFCKTNKFLNSFKSKDIHVGFHLKE